MARAPLPMHSEARAMRTRQIILGALLALAALSAFGGGLYGMSGADGIPVELLTDTPFIDYFIPGLVLFVVVGGALFAAAVACSIGHSFARRLSFISIGIALIWLVAQILMIGFVSIVQPITAVYLIILVLVTFSIPARAPASFPSDME